MVRQVMEDIVAIPVGDAANRFGGMLLLNEVSRVIWTELEKGADIDGLVTAVTDAFEVSEEEARADILELLEQLRKMADMFEAAYEEDGAYPAWEYKKDSRLRDVMVSTYQEMFNREAKVEAIHAGLECGLFMEKLPGLDCVSIGPQMHDIHTSRERLEIGSTQRTWDFLRAVLKNL